MSFEHQAIIGFLNGPGSYDNPVKVSCLSLAVKWSAPHGSGVDCPGAFVKSQNVIRGFEYHPNWNDIDVASLKDFLPLLDETWRLYVVGHGNWVAKTCGGVDGLAMAQLLIDGGLRQVGLISVVACGGDAAVSGSSFAGLFHYFLGSGRIPGREGIKVRTRVYGRNVVTAVVPDPDARAIYPPPPPKSGAKPAQSKPGTPGTFRVGSKVTSPEQLPKSPLDPGSVGLYQENYKRPDSKFEYYWEGDQSKRRPVVYNSN